MAATSRQEDDGGVLHSCEICGQEGLGEEALREHVRTAHIIDAVQCPFCDLGGVTTAELSYHVNSVHLDYLTPELEDKSFLEEADFQNDFNDIWQLERRAKDGLTRDVVGKSPMTNLTPVSNDDMKSDVLAVENTSSQFNGGAIQKRMRVSASSPRSRGHMSLDVHGDSPTRRRRIRVEEVIMTTCPLCSHQESNPQMLQEHVNRSHFDLTSPAVGDLSCPICSVVMASSAELERHVNAAHSDILSPQKPSGGAKASDTNGNLGQCPICDFQAELHNANILARHVESHFTEDAGSNNSDYLLAQEMDRKERERKKFLEEKELAELRAQYGMDGEGNFRQQATSGMERAVSRGNMSVVDYHQRRIELNQCERLGIDDGRTVTRGAIPMIRTIAFNSPAVSSVYLSSATDHFASSSGDRGWGCGYRNFQMLLSSLVKNDDKFGPHLLQRTQISLQSPSISRLQLLIESAWQEGFDLAGRDQLSAKLHNTRKWIGATEIAALLTHLRIKAEIVDFHRPTANDGTHPALFNWVLEYFRSRSGQFTPPLYFQHQGHSRTIVGLELLNNGQMRLLVFDPSHSNMSQILSGNEQNVTTIMKGLRKFPTAVKSRQYQIVCVTGLLRSEQEVSARKVITPTRIP